MAARNRRHSSTGHTLYEVLDIPKIATQEEIRKAYRRLALRYHPDKNPNNPEATQKFQEINYAHRILSDVTKRSVYDQYGSMGLYIADQIGEENIGAYQLLTSPWCKAFFICCGIITGCYCLCCCCCCCNFCCGRYKQQMDMDGDEDFEHLQEDADGPTNDSQPIITAQPTSGPVVGGASASGGELTALPYHDKPSYDTLEK